MSRNGPKISFGSGGVTVSVISRLAEKNERNDIAICNSYALRRSKNVSVATHEKVLEVTGPPDDEPAVLLAGLGRANGPVGIFGYSPTSIVSAGLAGLKQRLIPGRDIHLATVAGALVQFGHYPVETVCLDYNGLADASIALLQKQMELPGSRFYSDAGWSA